MDDQHEQKPANQRRRRRISEFKGLPKVIGIVSVGITITLSAVAAAKEAQQTICCRTPGGSRTAEECLGQWAHLVPRSESGEPAQSRVLAVLQGVSKTATSLTVQLRTQEGNIAQEVVLPPVNAGIWVLVAPAMTPKEKQKGFFWETFPGCRAKAPPARTLLDTSTEPSANAASFWMAKLRGSCGKDVNTKPLLESFQLGDYFVSQDGKSLPATLAVRCVSLTDGYMGVERRLGEDGHGEAPREAAKGEK